MSKEKDYTKYLTPEEVAETLGVSVNTVIRRFGERDGVIDLGSQTSCHKRRKRMLRISSAALDRYLEEKQVAKRRR